MSHSKEPWSLYCDPGERPGIDDCQGNSVVWFSTSDMEGIEHKEDAMRIVACVNACTGIPTEQLERGGLEMPLLSTLADIRAALGVGDKPMLTELAGLMETAVRHRTKAIGALQNAIGMLTLYTSATDDLAQSGIQALKDTLFDINGG